MSGTAVTLQVEFTWLVYLLLAFFGFVGAVFKLYDKRQDQRFAEQDKAREEGGKQLREMLVGFSNGQRDAAAVVGEVKNELRAHGERMARLESDVAHVPTHEDIGAIHKRIDEIQKDVGRLPGIEHLLHGINDYLRENGK